MVQLRLGGSIPPPTTGSWCMNPSTGGSNPPGSGDEPDGPTNTVKTENLNNYQYAS